MNRYAENEKKFENHFDCQVQRKGRRKEQLGLYRCYNILIMEKKDCIPVMKTLYVYSTHS